MKVRRITLALITLALIATAVAQEASAQTIHWSPAWPKGACWIVRTPLLISQENLATGESLPPVNAGYQYTRYVVRRTSHGADVPLATVELEIKSVNSLDVPFDDVGDSVSVLLDLRTLSVLAATHGGTNGMGEPFEERYARPADAAPDSSCLPFGRGVLPDGAFILPQFEAGAPDGYVIRAVARGNPPEDFQTVTVPAAGPPFTSVRTTCGWYRLAFPAGSPWYELLAGDGTPVSSIVESGVLPPAEPTAR